METKFLVVKDVYPGEGFSTEIVIAETAEEVLGDFIEDSLMGDSEGMTLEEMIEAIDYGNGDGCDYLITVVNLGTGEIVYRSSL